MNHRQYTLKYYGTYQNFDNAFGVQCVDTPRHYTKELGFPIGPFGGSAINGWVTGIPFDSKWRRVEYKQGMSPRQGDIVFWSEDRCKYGHVAVCNRYCNKNVLRCFDQNGNGKGEPITPRFYNYTHVLGWFTLR